jgi:hypothetical protein
VRIVRIYPEQVGTYFELQSSAIERVADHDVIYGVLLMSMILRTLKNRFGSSRRQALATQTQISHPSSSKTDRYAIRARIKSIAGANSTATRHVEHNGVGSINISHPGGHDQRSKTVGDINVATSTRRTFTNAQIAIDAFIAALACCANDLGRKDVS